MLHIFQSIPTPSHSCSPGLCLSPSLRPHRSISLKSKNLKPYLVPFNNPEPNCVPFDASETHSWSLHCFRNSLMSPLPERKQSIVPLANLDNKIHFSKFFSHFFWATPKITLRNPSPPPLTPQKNIRPEGIFARAAASLIPKILPVPNLPNSTNLLAQSLQKSTTPNPLTHRHLKQNSKKVAKKFGALKKTS